MADLWPSDLADIGTMNLPHGLLQEQADLLARHTKHLLEGRVYNSSDELSEVDDPGPRHMRWSFAVFAPKLNYRYVLFSITHDIDLYPVRLEIEDQRIKLPAGMNPLIEDEETLLAALKEIFSAERTKQVVRSLMAQSVQNPEILRKKVLPDF
ncbi:MAG: hypothetical protein JNJ46_16935 [Myxococcales bacterium]|nr:hypothetical protein [Myxococcales bacterium]